MGTAADALRPHWMPNIHTVRGNVNTGLANWIKGREYQFHAPVATDSFTLTVFDARPLLTAFASDICRLAGAAFETVHSVDEPARTPKASAWFVIRCYYAAYYAANALCRIVGTSTSQLEAEHTQIVHELADAYGQAPVRSIQTGHFECVYDHATHTLTCRRLNAGSGGAHEMFWASFLATVRRLGDRILQAGHTQHQPVATKLMDLAQNLCLEGRNGGNWLSYVRNQVTYRHAHGVWFPYQSGMRRDTLRRVFDAWSRDAMQINLAAYPDADLTRFTATCAFVVSLCLEVLYDVARRCPEGRSRSFLATGPHGYLNRMGFRESRATSVARDWVCRATSVEPGNERGR